MKSLQESLFDDDLVTKKSVGYACDEFIQDLKKMQNINPDITVDVIDNRIWRSNSFRTRSIRIKVKHLNKMTTEWGEFYMIFEIVIPGQSESIDRWFMYTPHLYYASTIDFKNTYEAMGSFLKKPYVGPYGGIVNLEDPGCPKITDEKLTSDCVESIKRCIENFYKKQTINLMDDISNDNKDSKMPITLKNMRRIIKELSK